MVDTPPKRLSFVDYPESDGQPMSESDATRHYLLYCVEALRQFFVGHPQVYVSGNLFIYYQEGRNDKSISPDVFVVFGVSKRDRRSYKVWQERGKLPAFALEITSLSTRRQDEVTKPALYADLGITEYFQYDPTGDYLQPQLKGRRLVAGRYEPIPAETLPDGSVSIHSQTLGLDLRLLPLRPPTPTQFPEVMSLARELRLFDPATDAQLLTYAEVEQARRETEQMVTEERRRAEQESQRAEQESQRAEQAEQQLALVLEQLRSRGINLEP